jgi:general stress protein 26
MTELNDLAPDFVAAAHTIVYCTVGSVDAGGRPTSRVMHPIWEWDGERLTGWLTTTPSPKMRQLAAHPYVSCAYYDSWAVAVVADCRVEPVADDAARTRIWELFKATPPPLGYDPGAIGVPGWDGPTAPGFVLARVEPWRVQVRRVEPGVGVELRTWHAP